MWLKSIVSIVLLVLSLSLPSPRSHNSFLLLLILLCFIAQHLTCTVMIFLELPFIYVLGIMKEFYFLLLFFSGNQFDLIPYIKNNAELLSSIWLKIRYLCNMFMCIYFWTPHTVHLTACLSSGQLLICLDYYSFIITSQVRAWESSRVFLCVEFCFYNRSAS